MTAAATPPVGPSGGPPRLPPGLPSERDVLGRAGSENFTVASRLLPGQSRQHLLAFYGYARFVDQLGDAYDGDRLAALDWLAAELACALDDPARPGLHPLVARAVSSVVELGTSPAPLYDLIEANRRDQAVTRYATYEDLLGYCRLSANPVGRLVLAAFEASTPGREEWSDAICTALQLAEHWQDVAEDAAAGRVYLPGEDLAAFGVTTQELTGPAPASWRLRALLSFEVARARRLLEQGAPLVRSLSGRPRWAVAGFVAGGHAALDAVAGRDFDPLGGAPHPAPHRVAARLVGVLRPAGSGRAAA